MPTLPIWRLEPRKFAKVQVDPESLTRLKDVRIYLTVTGYPCLKGGIKLHHHLFGKPKRGLVWDHVNKNKLDCRRSNLRQVTPTMNALNKRVSTASTTGVRGVYKWMLRGKLQCWLAKCCKHKKQYTLYCRTKKEAIAKIKELHLELGAIS